MSFESFITEISPKNTSDISLSWNTIRETIQKKSSIISSSFLTWSYIRYTKINPIDDLDIFFKINFSNTEIKTIDNEILIVTKIWTYGNHQLKDFVIFDNIIKRYVISPIKLINHIWKLVRDTYTTTDEQNRNWECYTVFLSSKWLTIDCVPYTGVSKDEYKLIPKWWNNLYWKKTNPDIDKNKVNELDDIYDWKLKWVIKILKYWNKYKNTWVKFKSYLLECLIYYSFKEKCLSTMSYEEILKNTLAYIYDNIDKHCNIYDIPRYEYMYYVLDDWQKKRIKDKLREFYGKLEDWEYTTVDYLKN